MRDAELVQPPDEPAGAVEQVELIPLAAIDVERLKPARFDRNDRVVPHPIRPALLDDLAGVERHGQPNAEELRQIRGTWHHTPTNWDYRSAWICRSCGAAL
jgi:hypothetical protein